MWSAALLVSDGAPDSPQLPLAVQSPLCEITRGLFIGDHACPSLRATLVCRGIGRLASAKNDQVSLLGQATGIDSKRKMPMTLVLVMIFNILVALALGFVIGPDLPNPP